MLKIKMHLLFLIFLNLIIYSFNSSAKSNLDHFKSNYQYKRISDNLKQPENNTESQLQKLLISTNTSKSQQYFIHHNLAYLYFKQHHKDKTLFHLNTAIALVKSTNLDTYHLSKSLLLRARNYGILFRNTKMAIVDLKQAILVSNSSRHEKITNLRFNLQTSMAQAFNQLGQLSKAQAFSEKSLKTAVLLNDKNETIYALIIAGRIAFQQDNFDSTYKYFLKALQLSDSSTQKKQIASIELRLAIVYESQNIYEQALVHAKKAAALYSQISNKHLQIKSLRVLGNIYLSLGQDIDTALVHFINGLSIAKAINSVTYIGQMQHLIGRAYLLEDNIDKATKYLHSAQTVLKKSNSWFYLALNTIELAKLTAQQGNDVSQAIISLKKLLLDQNIQNYPSLLNETKKYLVKLYINKQDYKNAYLLQQQILADKKIISHKGTEQMIKKFDHDVEIKSLNDGLTKANINNNESKQHLEKAVLTNKILMLILFLLSLLSFFIYRQKHNWQKRFLQRCRNSFLNWNTFINVISIESTKKNSLGLLICNADINRKEQENTSQYQQSQLVEQKLSAISQLNISTTSSINHNTLWLLCDQPLTEMQHLLINITKQSSTPLSCVWINLDDFPHNISAQCIMFIEKLVNHLFETSAAIEDRQITRVIIQSKALPIIFSSKENDSMLDKIKQALQQSFITTTHCSFNAFDK